MLSMSIVGLLTVAAFAGSLNPPGAPAGTMKPLDQVEPRTPITSVPFTISASGSYYLTKNLTATGTAISISADDVTLDLSGFTLTGSGSGTYSGIYMNGRKNVEIRNGAIRAFAYGINDASSSGKNHRIIGIRVNSCLWRGIYIVGSSCLVRDCIVSDTANTDTAGSFYGIYISSGAITDCQVTGTGNSAIATSTIYGLVGGGGNISRNRVYGNGMYAAATVYAMDGGFTSNITDNTVTGNGGSATGNVYGINTNVGCTVSNNNVYYNGQSAAGNVYGLYVNSGGTASGNSVYSNGASATGSAVYGMVILSGSTVIGNTARSNGASASGTVYGIWLGGYNLVNNNTAYGNAGTAGGTNMNTVASCEYGTNCAP